jgi:hypothetical protein
MHFWHNSSLVSGTDKVKGCIVMDGFKAYAAMEPLLELFPELLLA